MPRAARLVIPNYPHHVIQRGHNRESVFASARDYRYYLENLWQWKAAFGCRVYAFCLMTNHVHLLIDPGADPEALGRLMKRIAGRQTRYVNALEHRTGTLWESRYKSSPVDTDIYLLACARYIELNPVRARMVPHSEHYPYSSYRAKVGLATPEGLDLDPCYLALGETPSQRIARYRDWVASAIPEGEWALIRSALQTGVPTGNERFKTEIEQRLGRRIDIRRRGRPAKQSHKEVSA